MPSANYVLLEKITVGAAGASSVTFNSIPQTGYTDLVVKTSARTTGGGFDDYLSITFNGDTGSNYADRWLQGYNGAASSGTNAASGVKVQAGFANGSGSTSSTFSSNEIYIPNYTSSSYKSISVDGVLENNSASNYVLRLVANSWNSTAAITSIGLAANNSFVQGSTFYLYGVAKLGTTPAIVPYATGGDTIMTDGTYWYHTFTSSGTFTPQKSLSCDYLVVAGGGGGGANRGGGGGAGGLRSTVTATGGGGSLESALSLASGTGYTVTIGAGGVGATAGAAASAVSGSNSVFSTITSTGGGRGGVPFENGASGGSGGAPGYGGSIGTGTANQGYDSGTSTNSGANGCGGGGGAGATGGNFSGANGGSGGNGVATSITGSSVTYAGGGGGGAGTGGTGGAGGTGGGGAGVYSTTGGNGTANTGGGGGGSGQNASGPGGNGGSGIVIVRYAV